MNFHTSLFYFLNCSEGLAKKTFVRLVVDRESSLLPVLLSEAFVLNDIFSYLILFYPSIIRN